MATDTKDFKFPKWADIVEGNRPFLDKKEYKGYCVQVHVLHNLYILIDCLNDSVMFPNSPDVIRFAWCTENGFAISSVRYINCEEGYLTGCSHLVNTAHQFHRVFESFVQNHLRGVRNMINQYTKLHPVDDAAQQGGSSE